MLTGWKITFGAVAASIALVTTTALALAGLRTESGEVEITAGTDAATTAQCGEGATAVSGGFGNPDFEPFDSGSDIFMAGLLREGRRVISAVGSNSGDQTGTLVAKAYCDGREPALETVTETKPVDNDFQSVSAKCKRGSEAVWGGFSSDGDDPILSLGSRRKDGRTWKAAAIQFGDPSTLTVFAYCDKREPGLKVKSKSVDVGADQIGTATARCPQGRKAVSGGYLQPGEFSTSEGSEIYFYESLRVGERKWSASGLNQGDPAVLKAFAYCK